MSTDSPEKRLVQAGRKTRDALRVLRNLVRQERKTDIENIVFAQMDSAVEEATDGLIAISNVFEEVLRKRSPEGFSQGAERSQDVSDLHNLQASLSTMKAEREELLESLQGAQQQLQKYADDLQILYTQERQKRAELAQAYERLQEADQLKADFLSTVNHELTTPLVPLDFSLQLIEKGELDSGQQDNLQKIKVLLNEHKRKIDGLINYAALVNQTQVVAPQPINIQALLDDALEAIQMLAKGRSISLTVRPIMTGLMLVADRDLLGGAIYQLAHNAVKFNQTGGQVEIIVQPDGDGLAFLFIDDGPGIPDVIMQRFGQDFNQIVDALQRGVEGLGLGIALANYVADAHGGKLTATTDAPKGTSVKLWLPQGEV